MSTNNKIAEDKKTATARQRAVCTTGAIEDVDKNNQNSKRQHMRLLATSFGNNNNNDRKNKNGSLFKYSMLLLVFFLAVHLLRRNDVVLVEVAYSSSSSSRIKQQAYNGYEAEEITTTATTKTSLATEEMPFSAIVTSDEGTSSRHSEQAVDSSAPAAHGEKAVAAETISLITTPDAAATRNKVASTPTLAIPNLLLIGAQKAGTSTLSAWLTMNLGVCTSKVLKGEPAWYGKEPHFFDMDERYSQGLTLYIRKFQHCFVNQTRNATYVMDATPKTMMFPDRVRAIYDQVPAHQRLSLKLIAILREPISRTLSMYNHNANKWRTSESSKDTLVQQERKYVSNDNTGRLMNFAEFAQTRIVNATYHEDDKSWYGSHIERWSEYFNRSSQLLIVRYDEIKSNPSMLQSRIQEFLGIEEKKRKDGGFVSTNAQETVYKIKTIDCDTQTRLVEVYSESNERLYQFLNDNPGPPSEERPFPKFKISNCSADAQF